MVGNIVYDAIKVEATRLIDEKNKMRDGINKWPEGYEAGINALRKACRNLLLDGPHGY